MTKRPAAVVLCACLLLLALGLAAGRYSALRSGALLEGAGIKADSLPPLEATLVKIDFSQNSAKININTAPAQQLTELPGIGEALSGRIVEYREMNGDFESIEEIMAVRGIGESVFAKIRDYITVE